MQIFPEGIEDDLNEGFVARTLLRNFGCILRGIGRGGGNGLIAMLVPHIAGDGEG
jgi:hypothetical protein